MSVRGTIRAAVGVLISPLTGRFRADIETRVLPIRNRLDQVESHARALETRSQTLNTDIQALAAHAQVLETQAHALDTARQALDTRTQALQTETQALAARAQALDARSQALETRLRDLDEGFHQHLPAFLNAVSSVGAFGHELARHRDETAKAIAAIDQSLRRATSTHGGSISELWARLEFVRREILYEMKFGSMGSTTMAEPQPAQILDTGKLAEARRTGRLRINLGCGHVALDGYVNVDKRDLPGVDMVADIGNLPFEPGTVAEIFSAHVLEHFPEEQLRRALLPHWRAVLAPRGIFRAIVPDGEAMLAHHAAGDYPFDDFRDVLFGGQEYDGDYHFNMFTPASLRKLLTEAGFHNIEVPVQGRRNGRCYEFEITAERRNQVGAREDDRDAPA